MTTATVEERLTQLEEKVAQLSNQSDKEPTDTAPQTAWWKKIVGVYKDDPEFAEAERLGREYRESLRPKSDETN